MAPKAPKAPKAPVADKLFKQNRDRVYSALKAQGLNDAEINAYIRKPEKEGGMGGLQSNQELWQIAKDNRVAQQEARGEYLEAAPASSEPALTTVAVPPNASVAWWNNQAYTGTSADATLANAANALLPELASGEQQAIAKWMGENFNAFADYAKTAISNTQASTQTRNYFFSKARAAKTKANLESMAKAAGADASQLGPGYQFLVNVTGLLDKYGGDDLNAMSRASYSQMQADFDKMTSGVDASYVELGRSFLNPSSQGNPLRQAYTSNGRTMSGIPNSRLFV